VPHERIRYRPRPPGRRAHFAPHRGGMVFATIQQMSARMRANMIDGLELTASAELAYPNCH
jgi:hypothetical protein